MLETNDFRSGWPQADLNRTSHDQLRKRLITSLLTVATDQNGNLAVSSEYLAAVLQDGLHPFEEITERSGVGQAVGIFVVADHSPVRWMQPNKVEGVDVGIRAG